ncbi:MAG: hypothetical protein JXR63_05865 [Spirochaetales bacterium]|nr:hypothetical protein [Spirochaetales bacterium]
MKEKNDRGFSFVEVMMYLLIYSTLAVSMIGFASFITRDFSVKQKQVDDLNQAFFTLSVLDKFQKRFDPPLWAKNPCYQEDARIFFAYIDGERESLLEIVQEDDSYLFVHGDNQIRVSKRDDYQFELIEEEGRIYLKFSFELDGEAFEYYCFEWESLSYVEE